MKKDKEVSEETLIKASQERFKKEGAKCVFCEKISYHGLVFWNRTCQKSKHICDECSPEIEGEMLKDFFLKGWRDTHGL